MTKMRISVTFKNSDQGVQEVLHSKALSPFFELENGNSRSVFL